MTNKPGKEIQCSCCNKIFIFTDDEKKFYDEKGLQEPKRCWGCRNIAKIARRETINILKKYGFLKDAESEVNQVEVEGVIEGA